VIEERGLERLTSYTRRRLLGEHVPYPVEAYPEGGQRHLSAESGLYCRVFTEGLFGMRPVGFRSFDCTPRLPPHWDFMALRHVRAFGDDFDLFIERMGADRIRVRIVRDGTTAQSHQITPGETVRIDLSKAG
jgi:cellobiose phosphorylase